MVQASTAQDNYYNSSDLYLSGGVVECIFKQLHREDSLWVYAQLDFLNKPKDSLLIEARVAGPGESLTTEPLHPYQAFTDGSTNEYTFRWGFPYSKLPDKIILEIHLRPRIWTFVESIVPSAIHANGGITLMQPSGDLPVINPFLLAGDQIIIDADDADSAYIYYYSHDFTPSRPPMSLGNPGSSSTLKIDSIWKSPVGYSMTIPKAGLYFVQIDTTGNEGQSFYAGNGSYPKPTRIEELTSPLIYLTTQEEFQNILTDPENKKTLDKFWLSTLQDPNKARNSIKRFYQRVESANRYFTSYKEGWKTDRGMIYTIMGQPMLVTKDGNREIWEYQRPPSPPITFVFKKIPNIFSDNHYELDRQEELDRPWFLAIDRWRKGLIGF